MKHFPLGVYTFENMIQDGYLYVDKTAQLYELFAQGQGVYFLSRPRRFGKSLMLSTLKAIFEGKKELFKGLAIYDKPYDWKKYPVISINMATLENSTADNINKSLLRILKKYAAEYNISIHDESATTSFFELVEQLSKRQKVVILIDEYDKPILDNIDDLEECRKILRLLKSFYGVIKSADQFLRFAMLTGVSKFSKVSIFSDLNNLYDLTMDASFAHALGYTQKELESYFEEAINKLAVVEESSNEVVLDKIRRWYNGYRFSENEITLYNPVSIMNLLHTSSFKNYWFETGTPTFLLDLLKEYDYDIPSLNSMELSEIGFSSYEIEDLTIEPLLFQTGYITIKDYDKSSGLYTLGYPNLEVEDSFLQRLTGTFSPLRKELVPSHIVKLERALAKNDLNEFFETLKVFFAKIPYDIQLSHEKYYQTIFYLVFTLLGLKIKAESRTNAGRIDAVVIFPGRVYIFEFKLHDSAAKALEQIKEKKYYEKYLDTNDEIILIGAAFDKTTRNIKEFVSEKVEK